MLIRRALQIVGGITKNNKKMPGYAYGLPAAACKTGAKLRKKPGSVCASCYAFKGNYHRFPSIVKAQYRRLASIDNPEWTPAMITLITQYQSRSPYFRWHDTGDVQDLDHLLRIFEVCEATPGVQHWMPTKEAWVKPWLALAPSNLIVRFSPAMIDQPAPASWPHTATVVKGQGDCPAIHTGKCGDCRRCWSKSVKNIAYALH
jgi:hypothetical protein